MAFLSQQQFNETPNGILKTFTMARAFQIGTLVIYQDDEIISAWTQPTTTSVVFTDAPILADGDLYFAGVTGVVSVLAAMPTWLADDTDALNETCDIEQGYVTESSPTTIEDVPCMLIPPDQDQPQSGDNHLTLSLMVSDPDEDYLPSHRIIYNSLRYVINQVQRDENGYARLMSFSMPETTI
jgi:hypothetical protein